LLIAIVAICSKAEGEEGLEKRNVRGINEGLSDDSNDDDDTDDEAKRAVEISVFG